MDRVKQLLDAGLSLAAAVREALPDRSLSEFAERHALARSATSEALNGGRRAPDALIGALVAEFGGTQEGWRDRLQRARAARVAAETAA